MKEGYRLDSGQFRIDACAQLRLAAPDPHQNAVLVACSGPHNWFTVLLRKKPIQVIALALEDGTSKFGGRVRKAVKQPSDVLFFTLSDFHARRKKTRPAQKITEQKRDFCICGNALTVQSRTR